MSTKTLLLAALLAGCSAAADRADRASSGSAAAVASQSADVPATLPATTLRLRSFETHAYSGAFLRPDGRGIAAWHADEMSASTISLWDLSDDKATVRLLPTDEVPGLKLVTGFSWIESANLVVASMNNAIAAWDPTNKLLFAEEWHENLTAYHPRTELILAADQIGGAGVLNASGTISLNRQSLYTMATGLTHYVLWAGDEYGVVVFSGSVVFLRAKDGLVARALTVNHLEPAAVATTRATIAIGASDGALDLLDSKSLKTTHKLTAGRPGPSHNEPPDTRVHGVGFSPSGKTLAVSRSSALELWDVTTRKRTAIVKEAKPCTARSAAAPARLIWDGAGAYVACATADNVQVVAVQHPDGSGARIDPVKLPRGLVDWADEGSRLVVITNEGALLNWRPQNKTVEKISVASVPDQGFRPSTTPDFAYRASHQTDTRLERTRDGAAIRLRTVEIHGELKPLVYNDDGDYIGDIQVCRAVLARVTEKGKELSPTDDDCRAHARPELLARFFDSKI